MKIEYKPIHTIKNYKKNNKKHSEKQVQLIANSIRDFGFNQPIVIDKDNIIIAGHARLAAAKELGLTEVPTIKKEDLTPEQASAYRLADNKLSELGEWDFININSEITDLLDVGFSLENYGLENFIIKEEEIKLEENSEIMDINEQMLELKIKLKVDDYDRVTTRLKEINHNLSIAIIEALNV